MVSSRNMKVSDGNEALTLKDDYSFDNRTGKSVGILSKGKYISVYKSESGTFYKGDGKCIKWVENKSRTITELKCGLFKPNNLDNKKYYLYLPPNAFADTVYTPSSTNGDAGTVSDIVMNKVLEGRMDIVIYKDELGDEFYKHIQVLPK